MMSPQQRSERLVDGLRLKGHIPPDHLLRQLDRLLDLFRVHGAPAEPTA